MLNQDLVGERIRMMRRQRGLSQAQLAHPELSDSYVSLIESGKRTPTPGVLELLARKLDCSVTYLVNGVTTEQLSELELQVGYASLALENGEVTEARDRYAELLRDQSLSAVPSLKYRAEFGYALALEACGELEAAARQLVELQDLGEARGLESSSRIAIAIALCRTYRELGDLSESVNAGERALQQESVHGWTDDLVELGSTLLGAYYKRGDLMRGRQLASELLEIADRLGTPRSRVAAVWNAAFIADAVGQGDEAIALIERALAIHGETGDARNLARLRGAYAMLLIRNRPEDVEQIRQMLGKLQRDLAESAAGTIDVARCEVIIARIEVMIGDPAGAIARVRGAMTPLTGAPRNLLAEANMLLANAYLLRGESDEAAAELVSAADRLEKMQASRPAAEAWFGVAELQDRIGDSEASSESYRRALACAGL
ncbi:helix-turn-helix domain-containing protein [Rhizohabitans arisaemae]|uniref:helix-turn-helix domain-containing protein n=1 Tax=Rhizohabitans arisaemae TaxID=2720610 RepID=UPI0024B25845|nr:helix-turn-helix transcriptional regulator [Rhizohabitans arisaemae]